MSILDSPKWERYRNSEYKIYVGTGLWRYTVVGPGGEHITISATQRGAKRAIRKHRVKGSPPMTWECPVVYTEPASGVSE